MWLGLMLRWILSVDWVNAVVLEGCEVFDDSDGTE